MRKNVAGQVVAAQLAAKLDGSPVTSGTTTVYVTVDGGTQATTGSATHEGQGCWTYAPSQAETNGNHVAFTFINSNACPVTVNAYPVAYDPTDAVRLGLSALPNATAGASGGLPTGDGNGRVAVQSGTGAGQLSVTSGVIAANVTQFGGTAATASGGRPEVNVTRIGGQTASAAGAVAFATGTVSTYAGADTSGTTTLLSRLTATRAGYLDNLDATITSRLAAASYVAAPSAASVADAVWDEAQEEHEGEGSFGAALDAAVSSRATPAEVNAEVTDVLTVDTFAEPAGVPAATSSIKDRIAWLFALARNKLTQTATTQTLRNDGDTGSIATAAVEDDGTTFTRSEWL